MIINYITSLNGSKYEFKFATVSSATKSDDNPTFEITNIINQLKF